MPRPMMASRSWNPGSSSSVRPVLPVPAHLHRVAKIFLTFVLDHFVVFTFALAGVPAWVLSSNSALRRLEDHMACAANSMRSPSGPRALSRASLSLGST